MQIKNWNKISIPLRTTQSTSIWPTRIKSLCTSFTWSTWRLSTTETEFRAIALLSRTASPELNLQHAVKRSDSHCSLFLFFWKKKKTNFFSPPPLSPHIQKREGSLILSDSSTPSSRTRTTWEIGSNLSNSSWITPSSIGWTLQARRGSSSW